MKDNSTSRLLELDVFRGVAAMAVVLYHYTTRYDQLFGHPSDINVYISLPLGYFGVNLFFIISGFVIFLTLNRTSSSMDFIVSRFSRLYPVFWAAVTVTFIAMLVFGLQGLERTPMEYLYNLSMISGFFDVRDIDGVYWTLRYELLFYFWMLILFNLRSFRFIELVGLAWVFLSLASEVLKNIGHPVPGAIETYLILAYIHLFVAGIIFFRISEAGFSVTRLVVLAVCLLTDYVLRGIESVVIIALFFILFILFVKGWLTRIAIQPLVYLGTISYSLYLIHENIGFIAMQELYPLGLPQIPMLLIVVLISVGIAHLLTFSVEKPALYWIRQKYKHLKLKRSSVMVGDS